MRKRVRTVQTNARSTENEANGHIGTGLGIPTQAFAGRNPKTFYTPPTPDSNPLTRLRWVPVPPHTVLGLNFTNCGVLYYSSVSTYSASLVQWSSVGVSIQY